MKEMSSKIELPANRSQTWLRFNPIGECGAMLLAVTACFTALGWMVAAADTLAAWIILSACAWISLRSVSVGSGRLNTLFITFSIAAASSWVFWNSDHTLPSWLATGPFSASGVLVMLGFVHICDWVDLFQNPDSNAQRFAIQFKERSVWILDRYWGLGLIALFATYMVIVPGVNAILEQFLEPQTSEIILEEMTFAQNVRLRTTEAFTAVWFFVFGSVIGSYLNVVVYRSPRGESLIRKRSACPQCGSNIVGRDNIPVLGWLWLKGKCRNCQLPISTRYPLVEAATGSLFLLFYFVELLSGGINLPVRSPNHYAGVVWIIFYTKWDLIGLYLFHCLLLVALLTWSLIRFDQQRVRWRSYATTFVMALIPLVIWPKLQLVSAWGEKFPVEGNAILSVLLTAGVGTMVGGLLGALVVKTLGQKSLQKKTPYEFEFMAGLALTGAILGWQAACSVLAITLILRLVQHVSSLSLKFHLRKCPLSGCLFIAVILQLMSWRWMTTHMKDYWPTLGLSVVPIVMWSILTLILMLLVRRQLKTPTGETTKPLNSLSIQHN